MDQTSDHLSRQGETWHAALTAARLVGAQPDLFPLVILRNGSDALEKLWLRALQQHVTRALHEVILPPHVTMDRLTGGLDFAATLAAGRTIHERGLLHRAAGQLLLVPSAERLPPAALSGLLRTLDDGAARPAVTVALDHSAGDDDPLSAALVDRAAFVIDLSGISPHFAFDALELSGPEAPVAAPQTVSPPLTSQHKTSARQRSIDPPTIEKLDALAMAFGVTSLRTLSYLCDATERLAEDSGDDAIGDDVIAEAMRLVILPRATQIPQASEPQECPPDSDEADNRADEPPPEAADEDDKRSPQDQDDDDTGSGLDEPAADDVIAAVMANLPKGLLDQLGRQLATAADDTMRSGARCGSHGAARRKGRRGRTFGSRHGHLGGGARINLAETLVAAAPWQRLRGADSSSSLQIRPSDIRIYRHRERAETVAIFVVDASGSAAALRLGEAKGAVECLLAENYARRDQVAMVAMRGEAAEVILPATRSLVRAKRELAQLPGGGGTPLASGIDQARALADQARARGQTPIVIMLTDGQANITREGKPGRKAAEADALLAARQLAADPTRTMVIDVAYRRQPRVERLSKAMAATYLLLPQGRGAALSDAVRTFVRGRVGPGHGPVHGPRDGSGASA